MRLPCGEADALHASSSISSAVMHSSLANEDLVKAKRTNAFRRPEETLERYMPPQHNTEVAGCERSFCQ